ncbi:MAG: aspartate kinase [Gammaproteobacteria bacterium]|jgi:aspartate kinase|nr:aspartate kinase [Gammaproteobacteria bacterium]
MSLIVQKYGGTSVGDVERIRAVASRVRDSHAAGNDVVVVVSAMAGETDRLLDLANDIRPEPRGRELDVLLSTGEQVTIALLAMALQELGLSARSFTGAQVRISTDEAYNKARIVDIQVENITNTLAAGKIAVVAGFQGVNEQGDITTLGRGGTDTTAVAIAAALNADECQIYTDVDGVYTTDPRLVPEARRLDRVTYEEMLEMASLGAKVLQIRAVEFASKYRVALRVLSSFEDGPGTLIISEDDMMEEALLSGVTLNRDEAKLTMLGVPDRPGVASTILGPIANANIEVDMILQNMAADGTTDFTFTVHRNDYGMAKSILDGISGELGARAIEGDEKIAKISVVGVGMRSHAGIASRMFAALASEGINIQMISTSEIKISVVVDEKYSELGVRTLHSEFGLEEA